MDQPSHSDERDELVELTSKQPSSDAASIELSPSESGSAYIITLMVMLVLTLVGLSLTLISRSELMLSDNERTINRTFYAAESGLAMATAQILHEQKTDPATLVASDVRENVLGGAQPLVELKDTIEVSRSVPILDMPCDLCQVNSGDTSFHLINHAVTSVATRQGSEEEVPLAQTTVSAMVLLQPWMRTTSSLPTSSDEISKVRH